MLSQFWMIWTLSAKVSGLILVPWMANDTLFSAGKKLFPILPAVHCILSSAGTRFEDTQYANAKWRRGRVKREWKNPFHFYAYVYLFCLHVIHAWCAPETWFHPPENATKKKGTNKQKGRGIYRLLGNPASIRNINFRSYAVHCSFTIFSQW